ncbi:MAG: bifunctional phosphoribosylaminoimidazolecarboxamide formyltransferase/IMP cyclohydrolase [Bacteroidetes bacterium]|nr:bifunctional phosphoribosylaminoimidazolecarboxamide formyltransferase/IMP cyclohydrolase [Bacteroidota bacterium]MDA1119245.1 bifunctional phosphoribosylaminoimidazolecarboxamide formyltransferase/IMP cyclohydrolase [Bacteroidota bacterium]
MIRKIKTALISVYYKDGLDTIVQKLHNEGVKIYSTGGTLKFINDLGIEAESVEDLTGYPSILGGRVKTLHPKVFGGILQRSDNLKDQEEIASFDIPPMDLVIVDLYPFEETLASGADDEAIIEKIDIGGISLIRAAAKNHKDVVIVSSKEQYPELLEILERDNCSTDLSIRKHFATLAFDISSHYDSAIFRYFNNDESFDKLKISEQSALPLRYGENPHQKGAFFGAIDLIFDQLHGKTVSYNNVLDIDAAVSLLEEFESEHIFVIIKHTNACGVATGENVLKAYTRGLAGDPVSAFGGILATNMPIDLQVAEEINKLFFEALIAPGFDEEALKLLKSKKNRMLLVQKSKLRGGLQIRSMLNGFLSQEKDLKVEKSADFKYVSRKRPSPEEERDLLFANKIVKHSKSNAIVLARDGQLISSGVGQTSRVDALKQAIDKAKRFGFELEGTAMASDAFFPFPDCVEIAHKEGITSVIQPGGSVKDQESIDYCDANNLSMVFTGYRHFKH